MTPDDLLAAARALMQRPDAPTAGIWPRAAALLARQAIETAMAELWAAQRQAADLSGTSMRSQLLCLTAYLDRGTASRAAYLLAALSEACHYHSYELAPTAAELTGWLDETAQLVTLIQESGGPSAITETPLGRERGRSPPLRTDCDRRPGRRNRAGDHGSPGRRAAMPGRRTCAAFCCDSICTVSTPPPTSRVPHESTAVATRLASPLADWWTV